MISIYLMKQNMNKFPNKQIIFVFMFDSYCDLNFNLEF